MFKRKFHTQAQNDTIKCKTKGQPILLKKIINPRKAASTVTSPVRHKRARLVNSYRAQVAGTSQTSTRDAEDIQVAKELKKIPFNRRNKIVKKAGVKEKVKISKKFSLAMKETLGLSWRQEQKHKTLLKEIGVRVENEKAVRKLAKDIVGDFVKVEERTFEKEENKVLVEQSVPFSRIQDLPNFVDYLLELYSEKNMLVSHGTIPDDEIWVKIGGDHGKNSMKFTLQIGNIQKPNSKSNTIVIAMVEARDTHNNLDRFLDGGLGNDIHMLSSHTWQHKKIKLFLNGDYEFLTKMYGLSGAQGSYPWLWCLTPKHEIQNKSPPASLRNLERLHTDNIAFVEHGEHKKDVNKHNNSLHAPLIQLELDQVVPPYLHILLGIVQKHHNHLLSAAHLIDERLLKQSDIFTLERGIFLIKYRKIANRQLN